MCSLCQIVTFKRFQSHVRSQKILLSCQIACYHRETRILLVLLIERQGRRYTKKNQGQKTKIK